MTRDSDPLADTAVAQTAATTDADGRPRDSHVMLEIGKRLGDRYDIRGYLGEGGMGAVYRAFDITLGEEVALKVVRGTFATDATLRDEVRIAQKVTHENVCRTYDLEDIAGYQLVKMEYIAGETLAARIERGPLSIEEAVRIACAIAAGLEAAHARGIVHRDLKPGNVMLDGQRVVLMDFGLARQITDEELERAGTPGYMSPEQLVGGRITQASDYYALGCLLYEMLTGERAFAHGTMTEVAARRANQPAPDLRAKRPSAPRWLARATQLLLANDPTARSGGLRALVDRAKVRRRNLIVFAAVALGILAGNAWWIYTLLRPTPTTPWAPKIVDVPIAIPQGRIDRPALSPDGKTLAFVVDLHYERRGFIYTVPFPAGGKATLVPNQTHPVLGVRWYDATRFAVGAMRGPEDAKTLDVAVFDPATGNYEIWGPGYDPDVCNGAIVALHNAHFFEPGSKRYVGDALVMYAAPGAKPRQLVPASGELDYPRCDASGRVVYEQVGAGLMIFDGKVSRTFTTNEQDEFGAFTRDGTAIVFARGDGKFVSEIHVRAIGDETASTKITDRRELSLQVEPSRADDDHVVYLRSEIVDVITMHDTATGRESIVTEDARDLRDLAVMPGGIVGTRRGTIIAIDYSGRQTTLVDGALPISLDGRRIYYRHATAVDEVWSIEGKGPPVRVADLEHPIVERAGGHDGLHFLLDDHGREYSVRVDANGKVTDDGHAGIVAPAPLAPWRVRQTTQAATIEAPGKPTYTLPCIHPVTWLDAHRAACSTKAANGSLQLSTLDVRDGSSRVVAHDDLFLEAWFTGDGRWFLKRSALKTSAHAITNFASRPGPAGKP